LRSADRRSRKFVVDLHSQFVPKSPRILSIVGFGPAAMGAGAGSVEAMREIDDKCHDRAVDRGPAINPIFCM
jgi:hypothetical protein